MVLVNNSQEHTDSVCKVTDSNSFWLQVSSTCTCLVSPDTTVNALGYCMMSGTSISVMILAILIVCHNNNFTLGNLPIQLSVRLLLGFDHHNV